MYSLSYVKPGSLAEAQKLLASHPEAKLLAGGMTLIPSLKQRLARPSHLVDIGALAELRGIEAKDKSLHVGAATRHYEVAGSELVKRMIPALASLASQIGDPQVRNSGTIGGSVANHDPAADYPAAVLALDATIHTNRRDIRADDFFTGLFSTALGEGEIIKGISFPQPIAHRQAYCKFPHPASGYAMTGVFIADAGDAIRVAVTGAGPGVFRWKEAELALAKSFSAKSLAGLAMKPDNLNVDIHGSAAYRANLVKVMATRALQSIGAE